MSSKLMMYMFLNSFIPLAQFIIIVTSSKNANHFMIRVNAIIDTSTCPSSVDGKDVNNNENIDNVDCNDDRIR